MLRHIFADGGYAGPKLREALKQIGRWTVQIVKRSDTAERGGRGISDQLIGSGLLMKDRREDGETEALYS